MIFLTLGTIILTPSSLVLPPLTKSDSHLLSTGFVLYQNSVLGFFIETHPHVVQTVSSPCCPSRDPGDHTKGHLSCFLCLVTALNLNGPMDWHALLVLYPGEHLPGFHLTGAAKVLPPKCQLCGRACFGVGKGAVYVTCCILWGSFKGASILMEHVSLQRKKNQGA